MADILGLMNALAPGNAAVATPPVDKSGGIFGDDDPAPTNMQQLGSDLRSSMRAKAFPTGRAAFGGNMNDLLK